MQKDTTRHANANRVTMYTIQALGLRSSSNLTSVDQRGVRNTYQGRARYESATRASERQGLSFLAAETGGRSIFNQNRFTGELEKIAEDMSGYYSLASAPFIFLMVTGIGTVQGVMIVTSHRFGAARLRFAQAGSPPAREPDRRTTRVTKTRA